MGNVVLMMSMSLDGFVTGPNVRKDEPMGDGGEQLHEWMFAGKTREEVKAVQLASFADKGAILMGRTMLDLGLPHWGETPVYHAPCFVVSHRPHETIVKQGGTSFEFVTDGIDSALAKARRAAGDKDIAMMGGADTARQFLRAGMIDVLDLHLANIFLGGGARLFEDLAPASLEKLDLVDDRGVTHVKFRVVK